MGWQRARHPEQKERRRQDILAAAADLFAQEGLEAASLNRIVQGAGLSKATFYQYFDSRETVFLQLLLQDYDCFAARVEERLAPFAGTSDPERLVNTLVDCLLEYPNMLQLLAALASVLERHAAPEKVIDFKRPWYATIRRIANAIAANDPEIQVDQATSLVIMFHFLIIGIWPSSHLPPAVIEAICTSDLGAGPIEFEPELRARLLTYLRGLLAEKS